MALVALLEGVALLGIVIYLLTGEAMDLVIAAVPVVVMAVAAFPTGARWRRFVG